MSPVCIRLCLTMCQCRPLVNCLSLAVFLQAYTRHCLTACNWCVLEFVHAQLHVTGSLPNYKPLSCIGHDLVQLHITGVYLTLPNYLQLSREHDLVQLRITGVYLTLPNFMPLSYIGHDLVQVHVCNVCNVMYWTFPNIVHCHDMSLVSIGLCLTTCH